MGDDLAGAQEGHGIGADAERADDGEQDTDEEQQRREPAVPLAKVFEIRRDGHLRHCDAPSARFMKRA